MADVSGFLGVRYRLDSPEAAEALIAPPYDVISPAGRAALEAKSEHNVIRLELPLSLPGDTEQNNRYTRAAACFDDWLADGVLMRDTAPTMYVYGQRYALNGVVQERLGLMAALKVEPYEAGVVLPHEQTFPSHKEDRFRLLSTARAQFSPIFGLYSAGGGSVRSTLEAQATGAPDASGHDHEGVEHRLWSVNDPAFLEWARALLADQQVFIADGHHRYETALRYSQHRRAEAPEAPPSWFDRVMIFLVEMEDPGLILLPTHRMLAGSAGSAGDIAAATAPWFDSSPCSPGDVDDLNHHQIGVLLSDGALKLTLRSPTVLKGLDSARSDAWRDLDVVILHELLLPRALGITDGDRIGYTRDASEARQVIADGSRGAVFFMPAPSVAELKAVAGAGDKMPHKSTYFWPKAVTGLVIHAEP